MSNYGLVPYNDELYHYGVPGMKWGIRRSDKSLRRNISKLGLKNANLDEKRKQINDKEQTIRRRASAQ